MQQQAVEAMQPFDLGIFVAPPGSGKTVLGAYMAALRGVNTLVLVHRKPLLDQWRSQLQRFLGLGAKEVGQIGGGRQKATGCIDVAMIQSLASREGVSDLVGQYGQVIIDECHHAPALNFERVMREVRAKHVLGLTATPYRRDGLPRLLHFQCGPVRFQARRGSGGEEPAFTSRLVVRETRFNGQGTIQDLYGALVADPFRNDLIIRDVRRTLEEGRSPIVLTERREHLDLLAGGLRDAARHVVVLHGGVSAKLRRAALERLGQVPPDEPRLILATGRYIGEGFDDPRLDTLFMAMPIAWKGTLIQYAGRLHREHPGKCEVRIYDYLDDSLPVFRKMFEKRMKGYRAMGYETMEEGARMPLFPAGDVIQSDF
jgi:superfamily II DNA or RNA helicase